MAATCAACLEPIGSSDKFVLSGTEVFHRACTRNISNSVGTRAKLAIVKLKQQALDERRLAAEARIEVQNAENLVRDLEREVRRKTDTAIVESGKAAAARSQRDIAERNVTAALRDRNDLQADLDSVRGQLAAARNEVLRLQGELLRNATDKLPVPESDDHRDDTEIRFSLLELDKP